DHALEGEVVGLGGTAREDDVLRLGVDEPGDLLATRLDGLLGLPPESVAPAGGVPEHAAEVRHHRLEHPRVQGRRGVVVHVDALALHGPPPGKSDNPDPVSPLYGRGFSCQPSDRVISVHKPAFCIGAGISRTVRSAMPVYDRSHAAIASGAPVTT